MASSDPIKRMQGRMFMTTKKYGAAHDLFQSSLTVRQEVTACGSCAALVEHGGFTTSLRRLMNSYSFFARVYTHAHDHPSTSAE